MLVNDNGITREMTQKEIEQLKKERELMKQDRELNSGVDKDG